MQTMAMTATVLSTLALLAGASACSADREPTSAAAARAVDDDARGEASVSDTVRNPLVTARTGAGHYDLGDYVIHGEVRNDTDAPIHDVQLEVTFQDADGRTIADGSAATAVSRIDPGMAAPVVKTHYAAPEGIVGATFKVVGWRTSGPHHAVRVGDVRAAEGRLGVIVTGRGRNETDRPLSNLKLVTAFRDAKGRVAGVAFDYPVNGTLRPGASFDFTVETFDSSVAGADVQVLAEGTGP